MEFLRIRSFLKKYTKEVEQSIDSNNLDITIDKVTLNEYIDKSIILNSINSELLKKVNSSGTVAQDNLTSLNFFEIYTIGELDKYLNDYKEKIIDFYTKWMSGKEVNRIYNGVSLFYLYYVLIYEDYDENRLKKYLQISRISKEYHKSVIERFNTLIESNFNI